MHTTGRAAHMEGVTHRQPAHSEKSTRARRTQGTRCTGLGARHTQPGSSKHLQICSISWLKASKQEVGSNETPSL